MNTELAPTQEAASPSQCTATTGRGTRCRAYAVKGKATCLNHSRTPEERKLASQAAAARSAEVRAGFVAEREDAQRQAKLGFNALLGQRLEAKAERVADLLESMLDSEDRSEALAALRYWTERVHGRPVTPTVDMTPERNPVVEAFASLTPDQRRALLSLAQPLPTDPDTASVQG